MKKILLILVGMIPCMTATAAMAVTVKKAAPVATQAATSSSDATASLLPTVLSLVSNVQQLTQKQKELTAACIPSSAEITFVDNTMKEWAKTGASTADEMAKALKRNKCSTANGGYAVSAQVAAGTDATNICFDYFAGAGNDGMVWAGFPKVGKATYCADGSLSCAEKDKKTVSDIYEIFNLIDFSEADYTPAEATMAAKLIAKIEDCSYAKLSAKKKAVWGEFLTTTIGNVGQPTNTGTIMQSVSGVVKGGGLSSLGSIATQFISQ